MTQGSPQGGFGRLLTAQGTESRIQHRAHEQVEQNHDADEGKATARLWSLGLRVSLLVGRGVWASNHTTVEHLDPVSVPVPAAALLVGESLAGVARQTCQHALGQALPGSAVGTILGRAGLATAT